MRVLVTRPRSDAGDLVARLAALGCEAVTDPLLEIALVPPQADALAGATALVVTSRNALRALAASPALDAARRLPLFVVGPGTEAEARRMGFADLSTGAGTARDLVPLVAAPGRRGSGPVAYLAGDTLAFDLAPALAAAGCPVRQITVYRSVTAAGLDPATADLLARGGIDAVLLMSPRTAGVYAALVAAAGLAPAVRDLDHCCMSPRVAAALAPLGLHEVVVAERPTTEDLLALLAARRHTPPRAG